MNWYKLAQYYQDVLNEQKGYNNRDKETSQAELYFSIGQNEETIGQSYCWIFVNNTLQVKKGHGSHNMFFRGLTEDINKHYRGWDDPVQDLLSVVIPNYIGIERTANDVPNMLDKVLRKKFGNTFEYKIF